MLTPVQGYEVHACDLIIDGPLQSLPCRLHRLDVTSPESVSGLATQLANKPIDVLLNVAGVMTPAEQDSLETTNKAVLTKTFEVNTFGPLLVTQALLPGILAGGEKRVGIVSSRVGSMGDNNSGGSYAYRASKAGVNSIGRSLAVDLREQGVTVSLLHPGIVETNLNPTAGGHSEAVQPDEAAGKLWSVFREKGVEESGRFWHREGGELPW